LNTLKNLFLAVFWSFLGIRKSKDLEQDAQNLKPIHLILMGLLLMFTFIIALLIIVHLVVK
jgi:amino acid transporter